MSNGLFREEIYALGRSFLLKTQQFRSAQVPSTFFLELNCKNTTMSESDGNEVWNLERVAQIGTIMSRYADHVRVGHRVRLGIEGDPCNVYRSAEDAPRGEVVRVDRGENGYVEMDVRLESGESVQVDNRSVDPKRIWEIDPSFMTQFTTDAIASAAHLHVEKGEGEREGGGESQFRGEVYSMLNETTKQLKQLEDTESAFRKATTATIRHIVADLMNLASGNPLSFAREYADKYDIAMEGDASFRATTRLHHNDDDVADGLEEEDTRTNSHHTHAKKGARYGQSKHQDEKHNFQVTPLTYNSDELREAPIT